AAIALYQEVVIKCMKRLAPFEHDIVGDVHNVVDGPHARISQPPLHPARGSTALNAFDEERGITGGEPGVFDDHVHPADDRRTGSLHSMAWQTHRLPRQGRYLTRHAHQ